MSILDNIVTEATGNRRPMRTSLKLSHKVHATGESEPMAFGNNDEYIMSLALRLTFWCGGTSMAKEQAFRQARQTLIRSMYKDILPKINMARSALYGDDVETALTLLNEMERTVLGEE